MCNVLSEEAIYLKALQKLIECGAEVLLPRRWLLLARRFQKMHGTPSGAFETSKERFSYRFSNFTPIVRGLSENDDLYTVSSLLECFRYRFGTSLDDVLAILLTLEAQRLQLAGMSQGDSLAPPATTEAFKVSTKTSTKPRNLCASPVSPLQ